MKGKQSIKIHLLILAVISLSVFPVVESWASWSKLEFELSEVKEDGALFLVKYCGRRCQNGELVVVENLCTVPQCFPCDCNEHCSKKGTCCPEIKLDEESEVETGTFPSGDQGEMDDYFHGIYSRLECQKTVAKQTGMVAMVTTCPQNWTEGDGDRNVTEKCENPVEDSFESITPYIEKISGLVFGNIFCAECNGFVGKDNSNTDSDHVTGDTNASMDTSTSIPLPLPLGGSNSSEQSTGNSLVDPKPSGKGDENISTTSVGNDVYPLSPTPQPPVSPIESSTSLTSGGLPDSSTDVTTDTTSISTGNSSDLSSTTSDGNDVYPLSPTPQPPVSPIESSTSLTSGGLPDSGTDVTTDTTSISTGNSSDLSSLVNPEPSGKGDENLSTTSGGNDVYRLSPTPQPSVSPIESSTSLTSGGLPDSGTDATTDTTSISPTDPNTDTPAISKTTPGVSPELQQETTPVVGKAATLNPSTGFGSGSTLDPNSDTESGGSAVQGSNLSDGDNDTNPHSGAETGLRRKRSLLIGNNAKKPGPDKRPPTLPLSGSQDTSSPSGLGQFSGRPEPRRTSSDDLPGSDFAHEDKVDMTMDPFLPDVMKIGLNDVIEHTTSHHHVILERIPLNIRCKSYQNLYHIKDGFEFYQKAKELDECELEFSPVRTNSSSEAFSASKCPDGLMKPISTSPTPSCHRRSVSVYRELCHDLPQLQGLSVSRHKNIFCYLCTKRNPPSLLTDNQCQADDTEEEAPTPIVDIHKEDVSSKITRELFECEIGDCENNTLLCPPGKVLLSNGVSTGCLPAFSGIGGLTYNLNARLMSMQPVEYVNFTNIIDSINKTLSARDFALIFRFLSCDSEIDQRLVVDVAGHVDAPFTQTRDEFEKHFENSFRRISLDQETDQVGTLVESNGLDIVCLGTDLCRMYRSEFRKTSRCNVLNLLSTTEGRDVSEKNDTNIIDLTPDLRCPSRVYDMTNNPLMQKSALNFTINLDGNPFSFLWTNMVGFADDKLKICAYLIDQFRYIQARRNEGGPKHDAFGVAPFLNLTQSNDTTDDGNATSYRTSRGKENELNNSHVLELSHFISVISLISVCVMSFVLT